MRKRTTTTTTTTGSNRRVGQWPAWLRSGARTSSGAQQGAAGRVHQADRLFERPEGLGLALATGHDVLASQEFLEHAGEPRLLCDILLQQNCRRRRRSLAAALSLGPGGLVAGAALPGRAGQLGGRRLGRVRLALPGALLRWHRLGLVRLGLLGAALLRAVLGAAVALPLLQGRVIRGPQLRGFRLERLLLLLRHALPLLAGELGDDGRLRAAGLLRKRLAVLAEPEPVGGRRPRWLPRRLLGILFRLLVGFGLLPLALLQAPLAHLAPRVLK